MCNGFEIKDLQRKASDLRSKIGKHSAHLDYEQPIYKDQEAQVKDLILFHYDPTYSDQDLEKILDDTLKFQQNQYPAACLRY